MKEVKPDAVAHFAALAYIEESMNDPAAYYSVNTSGSLNVLNAMKDTGVSAIVFSSTCATYGVPHKNFIDESHPQMPINPYGRSKFFVEQIIKDFGSAYNIRSVCLRYFNAAGGDTEALIGERHVPETHVIPLAIRGALRKNFVFTIYGNDYATRDGTCVRDFVHVCDLANAHRRALDHLLNGGQSDVFNLGSGTGTTVSEIADAVERVTTMRIKRRVGPRRIGDPPQLVAHAAKAERILGWKAERSGIDDIISDAYKWHLIEDKRLSRIGE
jgi:UDP-arabinose 4-epimerase